eukprot:scaffold1318_cov388-Prasinococcus_capsulatus_cf.AAC.50
MPYRAERCSRSDVRATPPVSERHRRTDAAGARPPWTVTPLTRVPSAGIYKRGRQGEQRRATPPGLPRPLMCRGEVGLGVRTALCSVPLCMR